MSEIGRVFLENFAVANDGIERRPQLVAHIGEKLRFVLPRHFELPAFILDFTEQPGVLNRHRRLRRECLDEVDGVLRKNAGRAAADHQQANYILSADKRRDQSGAEAGAQGNLIDNVRGRFLLQVSDLDWIALRQH